MKLTDKSAQALANLRTNADFRVVLEWLNENHQVHRDECCKLSPEKVQRSQGKVEVVSSFFKAYEQAPEVNEKFKSNRR